MQEICNQYLEEIMKKMDAEQFANFDKFMKAMADVMGISRQELNKILFQGKNKEFLRKSIRQRPVQKKSMQVSL